MTQLRAAADAPAEDARADRRRLVQLIVVAVLTGATGVMHRDRDRRDVPRQPAPEAQDCDRGTPGSQDACRKGSRRTESQHVMTTAAG